MFAVPPGQGLDGDDGLNLNSARLRFPGVGVADGLSFGADSARQLSLAGNTVLVKRIQHGPKRQISLRSVAAGYEKLNQNLGGQPNFFAANGIWDIPGLRARCVHRPVDE